jgi:hypothetical protein
MEKMLRSFVEIRQLPGDEKSRTAEFIISSESKDRHGTVLSLDG